MILQILTILFLCLTLIGFARHIWWFTVIDFFRLQYACVGFFLLAFNLWQNNSLMAALSILVICINIYRIRKFLPQFKKLDKYHNKHIVSINAYKNNFSLNDLNKVIGKSDPEILLIMEMTDDTEYALASRLRRYEHKLETPVRDGFRICLLSKNPLTNKNITHHGPNNTPMLHADVIINGQEFHVFSAHPKPALNKEWHQERSQYFHEITPLIANTPLPSLVLGDFNSVPWEDHFERFLKETGLKSSLEGHGYRITWPVLFPVLGVPMDHILISQNIPYENFTIGPFAGSDHYPVSINLKS